MDDTAQTPDLFDPMWDDLDWLNEQSRFQPGNRCGDFIVIKQLGQGGQGEVFAAWDSRQRRYAALKFVRLLVVPPRNGPPGNKDQTGPDRTAELLNEVREAVRFGLPHFIIVHGLREDEEHPFIEMELAAGGSLGDWRDDRLLRASPRQIVKWMIPVCNSVHEAHRRGLIHFDIKPHNFLLINPAPDPFDEQKLAMPAPGSIDQLIPKLGDFGLARLAVTGRTPRGTLGFASPEQWGLTPDLAPDDPGRPAAIDGFGLAATLYFMFTGNAPWSNAEVSYQPPGPQKLRQAGLDNELIAVILKELSADPRDRYSTVMEFEDDLERWLSGAPVTALPYLQLRKLRHAFTSQADWVRGALLALVAAVIASTVLVIASTVMYGHKKDAETRAAVADLAAGKERETSADLKREATEAQQRALEAQLINIKQEEANRWTERLSNARLQLVGGEIAASEYTSLIGERETPNLHLRLQLRVERLPLLLAENRLGEFTSELDALLKVEDQLGALAAIVWAFQAERLSWSPKTFDAARRLAVETMKVRFANDIPPPKNYPKSSWDSASSYLNAMGHEDLRSRLDALRTAAKNHPFYFPIRRTFLLTLAGQARSADELAEFAKELQFCRIRFPKSPVPDFAESIKDAIRNNRTGQQPGAPLAIPSQPVVEQIRQGAAAVSGLRLPFGDADPTIAALERIIASANRIQAAAELEFPRVGFPYSSVEPVVEVFRSFEHYRRCVEVKNKKNSAASLEALGKLAQKYPDGALLILRAMISGLFQASEMKPAQDLDAVRAFAEPLQWFDRGCETTALPLPPEFLYPVQLFGLIPGATALRFDPEDGGKYMGAFERTLNRMKTLGRKVPLMRQMVCGELIRAMTMDIEQETEKRVWRLDSPEGRTRLADRKNRLARTVISLLDDWEEDERDNPYPPYLRAKIGAWAGYHPGWVLSELELVHKRDPRFSLPDFQLGRSTTIKNLLGKPEIIDAIEKNKRTDPEK